MRSDFSRREFIAGLGVLAAAKTNLSATPFPSSSSSETPRLGKSPFKIAVINDEISQDFGHACEVASQQVWHGVDGTAQHVEQERRHSRRQ